MKRVGNNASAFHSAPNSLIPLCITAGEQLSIIYEQLTHRLHKRAKTVVEPLFGGLLNWVRNVPNMVVRYHRDIPDSCYNYVPHVKIFESRKKERKTKKRSRTNFHSFPHNVRSTHTCTVGHLCLLLGSPDHLIEYPLRHQHPRRLRKPASMLMP
jgi:hypothetical protein